jgi:polyisoprenoid-binding protein YceI
MKMRITGLFVLAVVFFAACTSNPKSDNAEVSEAKATNKDVTGTAYTINAEDSKVSWVGTKPAGRHNGYFAMKSGGLIVNEGRVVGGSFVFDLTDITILDLLGNEEMHEKLAGHLRSADFFDTENHPEASFELVEIRSIKEDTDVEGAVTKVSEDYEKTEEGTDEANTFKIQNPTHLVTGNLTMRGTTLAITFPAEVHVMEGKVHARAKFNIDRTKWGISYSDESKVADKLKDNFIYNVVNVGFEINASPENI